jgi:hypothetical protein
MFASAQNAASYPLNEPNLNKPRLFNNQPDEVNVTANMLASLLPKKVGSTVSIELAGSFKFEGHVVSAVTETGSRLSSVVIRSTNFSGGSLTVSEFKDPATGIISYSGRIISMHHGDLYELQFVNGQYSFKKKNFYDLINE